MRFINLFEIATYFFYTVISGYAASAWLNSNFAIVKIEIFQYWSRYLEDTETERQKEGGG